MLASAALALLAGPALAGGTAPGITVSNSIDISYVSAGNTISETDAASVDFVVDRKVDFLAEGQDAGGQVTVEQGSDVEQLTFRIENEGNDDSGYDLDLSSSGAIGLTLDTSGGGAAGTYSVYVGSSAGPAGGSDTLYDPAGTTNIGDVAPDGEVFVKIVANIPDAAQDGDTDSFDLTVTALDAGTSTVTTETGSPSIGTVDTILADPGEDGVESDTESYVVSAPVLTAAKTSAIVSENLSGGFNCATDAADPNAEAYVPGGCVEYTITVSNDAGASAAASNLTITDPLPGEVSFVAVSSSSNFDSVSESGGTITATATSLAAGTTATATIRVTID